MKIASVNRGEVTTVNYKGAEVKTGIFKYPVNEPIFLGETDVVLDNVVDRKYHGGVDKAVYAYSIDHYPFWKERFPNLDWKYGMFGENLTIEGLDESTIQIGSIYEVGDAQIQVCQPRQPCFKLGIRFGTQAVLKQFVNEPYPGVYFRVLKPGNVRVGDVLQLVSNEKAAPSIAVVFQLLYHKKLGVDKILYDIENSKHLPAPVKESIQRKQTAY